MESPGEFTVLLELDQPIDDEPDNQATLTGSTPKASIQIDREIEFRVSQRVPANLRPSVSSTSDILDQRSDIDSEADTWDAIIPSSGSSITTSDGDDSVFTDIETESSPASTLNLRPSYLDPCNDERPDAVDYCLGDQPFDKLCGQIYRFLISDSNNREWPFRNAHKGQQGKNKKTDFRRKTAKYVIRKNGYGVKKLYYKHLVKDKAINTFKIQYVEVVPDQALQQLVIESTHCGVGPTLEACSIGGHVGINKTRQSIAARFYWPHIQSDVGDFIAACDRCQRAKTLKLHKAHTEMHPVSIPNKIWSQIGIDLVGKLTLTEDGYQYVLTVIDYFTKYVELIPLKRKTGQEVAYNLFKLMCRYGCPEVIISDQGKEFNNQINLALCSLTGVQHRITSAYHPQANGLVERMNQSIQQAMRACIEEQDQWYLVLDCIAMAFRGAVHSSTKKSPFEMMFGREMLLPIQLLLNVPQNQINDDDDNADSGPEEQEEEMSPDEVASLEEYKKDMEHLFQIMKDTQDAIHKAAGINILKAQEVQTKHYNKRHLGNKIEVGSQVMKQNRRQKTRQGGGLEDPWKGPFTVVDIMDNGNMKVKNGDGMLLEQKVPSSHVKSYIQGKNRKEPLQPYKLYNDDDDDDEHINPASPRREDVDIGETASVTTDPVRSPPSNGSDSGVTDLTDAQSVVSNANSDISVGPMVQGEPLPFLPLTKESRQELCAKVNIKNRKPEVDLNYGGVGTVISSAPKRRQIMKGDGNCLFRAICFAVSGSQLAHTRFRQVVAEHIKQNGTYTGVNGPNYLNNSRMGDDTIYGTDVELMAAAELLNRDIYVYHPYGSTRKWHRHNSDFRKGKKEAKLPIRVEGQYDAIYLDNRNGTGTDGHYDVAMAF